MDGFAEYMDLILKEFYSADFPKRPDHIDRDSEAIKAEPDTSAVRLGRKPAQPGDYAYAWQMTACKTPVLVGTGHDRTDYILMIIHAIHKVYDRYAGIQERDQPELDSCLTKERSFHGQHKTAYQAAIEAKHQAQVYARYQKELQAQAKRALEEHRGGVESLERERWEWHSAIAIASRLLMNKGIEYANTRTKLIDLQAQKAERMKDFETLDRNTTHVRQQMRLHAIPQFQYALGKASEALYAMQNEKGNDERYVMQSCDNSRECLLMYVSSGHGA